MYYNIIIFVSSLAIGSFLHTLGVRLVNKRYIGIWEKLTVPSRCDCCDKRISPVNLIPVIGYFLSKGKCKYCGSGIPLMYPILEFVFALIILQISVTAGLNSISIYLLIIAISASVSITAADIYSMKIPDVLVLTVLAVGIIIAVQSPVPMHHIWGGAFLFAVFFAAFLVLPGSFGAGDVKYAAAAGLVAGYPGAVILLETALVIGSVFGITYSIISGKGTRIRIPFAPFISIGLYVAVFYEKDIMLLYQNIFYQ